MRSTRPSIRTLTPRGVASTIGSPTSETRHDLRRGVARVQRRAGSRWKTSRTQTRTRMNAGADSLLTVRWRDRSFVLRAPEQVEQLARRLRQKGLANIAVSIRGAVVEGSTGSRKVLSDEECKAVCAVLIDAESDPALRRAFTLLCAEPEPLERPQAPSRNPACGTLLRPLPPTKPAPSGRTSPDRSRLLVHLS